MKVTMKELRQLIREAIEECGSGGRYELEENMASPPDGMEESVYGEGSYEELEEAWSELEEAANLKESKKAKAAKEEEEEKPAKGMMITKAQLMKALKLNPHQEKLFVVAIKRGHSVAKALEAAAAKPEKKE